MGYKYGCEGGDGNPTQYRFELMECEKQFRVLLDENIQLKKDVARLDWLEQHAWTTERECFDFVDAWRTPDGKRHSDGLRSAIDALMTPPNV